MKNTTSKMNIIGWPQLNFEAVLISDKVHRNQSYGIFPYKKHLMDVCSILSRHGFKDEYYCAGRLHDSMEDGSLSYNEINEVFGSDVADMVLACTDPMDAKNRAEKKKIVITKLKVLTKAIPVKLADRIANIAHSIRMNDTGKIKMYWLERKEFGTLENCNDTCNGMWDEYHELMNKIAEKYSNN